MKLAWTRVASTDFVLPGEQSVRDALGRVAGRHLGVAGRQLVAEDDEVLPRFADRYWEFSQPMLGPTLIWPALRSARYR